MKPGLRALLPDRLVLLFRWLLTSPSTKEKLEAALRESEGVVGGPTGAAVKLGIPRQTLESRIQNRCPLVRSHTSGTPLERSF